MPDLMAVIDGKPVPLDACGWFQRNECGCIISALVAAPSNGNIGSHWECSQHSMPPGEPCACGKPIPAGRKAYCSDACRLADKDHGPDSDETGGDES
jgi:hypothetical protein